MVLSNLMVAVDRPAINNPVNSHLPNPVVDTSNSTEMVVNSKAVTALPVNRMAVIPNRVEMTDTVRRAQVLQL